MVSNKNTTQAKYYGRKEICLLVETSVQSLFPLPEIVASSSTSKPIPSISEWVAYILYRTALPNQTIFHALHLLRRVSALYDFQPSPDSPFSPLVHHRLVLSSFILATVYHMDDSYSNKSWAIASKGVFALKEINEMEMEMLECLDFRIGEEGVSSIVEVIEAYEIEFNEWEEQVKNGSRPISPLPEPVKASEQDIIEFTLSRTERIVEVSSNASSSASSISSKSSKKTSHSIWSHFTRPKCGKSQPIPGLGNIVSFH